MPVFFYIDPDFVNDPNMRGIEQVTLSYTFFSGCTRTNLRTVLTCNRSEYDKHGHLTPVPVGN